LTQYLYYGRIPLRMKGRISKAVESATSLDEISKLLIRELKKIQKEGEPRIGYIAGIITSDGPENISQNVARLSRFTKRVRQETGFPIFSSTDVFSNKLFAQIGGPTKYTQRDWHLFWRKVLGSGAVTDVFMTPRWQESRGATDEHKTSTKMKVQIHIIDYEA